MKRMWRCVLVACAAIGCVRGKPLTVVPDVVAAPSGTERNQPASAVPASVASPRDSNGSAPAVVVPQSSAVAQQASIVTIVDSGTSRADGVALSSRDVIRSAVGIFGDSVSAAPAAAPAADGPTWDIDVQSYATTDRVAYYVGYFSGAARERIEARLVRGTQYEPMIRQKLRDGGLPEDMYYLALIESGFDPNAYSRAAAVGMWQFMASTGRGMGLRIDWWVDERRDPVRSTDAAVRFIKGLNEQFGSLYLAAAAYNGGPGRISRGLTRFADDFEGTTGDDLFFALAGKDYLKGETREYVPQLIASALIAKEPQRYGLEIDPLPPFAYDSVRVGAATPLTAIARASGSTTGVIRDLNPQFLRGMTPPKDSVRVRVPAGTAATFDSLFATLPDDVKSGGKSVKTKAGETMAAIAKRAGISTARLTLFNPSARRLKSGKLVTGQMIFVPTRDVAAVATEAPDPSIERYGSVVRGARTHVVKKGEALSTIAKKYGTTTKALMQVNGLRKDLIFAGQTLALPRK